ncbi:MAG: hypothetical protein IT379_35660 [Deltaproteobacteria bacterium]|nr:hypothetical protein [Deltaproteobacteria bacterium]
MRLDERGVGWCSSLMWRCRVRRRCPSCTPLTVRRVDHHGTPIILIAMSKRLQVVMSESDHRALTRLAKQRGMPLSEWVRQALRDASRHESPADPRRKLQAIRAAMKHSFPAPDIDTMLEEIERGYTG